MDIRTIGIWMIVLIGLFTVLRRGRWAWRVTESKPWNIIFWVGWFTALTFGIRSLFLTGFGR